jgi:hypothetical protein
MYWLVLRSEGGDSDTRRRAAADLVRALTDTFEAQVTQLFTGYVGALLQVGGRRFGLGFRCWVEAGFTTLNPEPLRVRAASCVRTVRLYVWLCWWYVLHL